LTTTKDAKESKVRIYQLAKDLDVETSVLVDICHDAGFDKVRSQLSSVDTDQIEIIKKALKARSAPPPSTPSPQPPPILKQPMTARPPVLGGTKVPTISPAKTAQVEDVTPAEAPQARDIEKRTDDTSSPSSAAKTSPTVGAPTSPAQAPPKTLLSPDIQNQLRNLNKVRTLAPRTPPTQGQAVPPGAAAAASASAPTAPAPTGARPIDRRSAVDRARPSTPYSAPSPAGRRKIVMPGSAPATAPSAKPGVMKPLVKFTPDMITAQKGPVSTKDLLRKIEEKQQADKAKVRKDEGGVDLEEEDEDGKLRPGLVKGREERHKKRSARAKAREDDVRKLTALLDDDDDRPTPTRLHRLHRQRPSTLPRKGTVVALEPPVTIRSLSEALGVKAADILKKLVAKGQTTTINSSLEDLAAEELAIELGYEIKIQKGQDAEQEVLDQFQKPTDNERLTHRPPIVTVMGHVDHGKTSLLDRIRESNVVATEAGGITQHIRAWKVLHGDKTITFLDTPGHAAFTQMRARGANVTDIVILVVAADDGIMPQTDEAISHAKAANVPIIIAINKVDLPNANINRTRQQLYAKELIPDDMGGDTPFIETVATKDRAKGIQELLDMILLVAELKDLKADPTRPANGTCLEARVNGDEGVVANLLVQDGTLHRGDVILCGTTYGRARQMFDDHNQPLEEAGPSTPVRVIGLEAPPEASDKFYVVDDIAQAREIADSRLAKARDALTAKRAIFRLEDLGKTKAIEVKIIVKADVKGSIEAIKKDLEKLHHEEVKIKILHTAVGGITDSDVQLALASPEDTLIVGFNVVADDDARKLADEKGIQIRLYDIIYKLSDDLKSALEGKLKPREEVVHLGRAVVRDIFKISRVGTVAGCHVTSGTIERSARVRLIRDGVVIYPPADKTATLDSLKRHKDDVREVREGYECGMKIAGFDDVKVGDVIEAFHVEQVQRTLS
jgi:translation initiation factor IF-2